MQFLLLECDAEWSMLKQLTVYNIIRERDAAQFYKGLNIVSSNNRKYIDFTWIGPHISVMAFIGFAFSDTVLSIWLGV